MAESVKGGYFLPITSNKSIENYEPRHAHNAAKGAFSDEARDALAKAVSDGKTSVKMDDHTMQIKRYTDYVHVVSTTPGGLPCGNFDRKTLASRLEATDV